MSSLTQFSPSPCPLPRSLSSSLYPPLFFLFPSSLPLLSRLSSLLYLFVSISVLSKFLSVLTSKYIQNLTTFHHLHSYLVFLLPAGYSQQRNSDSIKGCHIVSSLHSSGSQLEGYIALLGKVAINVKTFLVIRTDRSVCWGGGWGGWAGVGRRCC